MRRVVVSVLTVFAVWQARAADSWFTVEKDAGDGISAATQNQTGQLLGQYCDYAESACYWNLLLDTPCDKGVTVPSLISEGANSAAITAHCQGRVPGSSPATYRYLLSDFDTVDKVVRGGGIVGIAFALDSGRFQVVRFSSVGAAAQLDSMRTKANSKAQATTGSSKL